MYFKLHIHFISASTCFDISASARLSKLTGFLPLKKIDRPDIRKDGFDRSQSSFIGAHKGGNNEGGG